MIITKCDKCGLEIESNNPNATIIFKRNNTENKHLCNYCCIALESWLKYGGL